MLYSNVALSLPRNRLFAYYYFTRLIFVVLHLTPFFHSFTHPFISSLQPTTFTLIHPLYPPSSLHFYLNASPNLFTISLHPITFSSTLYSTPITLPLVPTPRFPNLTMPLLFNCSLYFFHTAFTVMAAEISKTIVCQSPIGRNQSKTL